jgi:uncharacterized protein YecE (DUF72 family)
MQMLAGTSGYAYKEWLGHFYPEALPAHEMLPWYAKHLPTVEINNTFYRMPAETLVARWRDEVPKRFCFALKAPRFITHIRRLKETESSVAEFFRRADVLGDRLGVILFQLPPTLRKDLALLGDFLGRLPAGRRVAFEFRHDSWHDEGVYDLLRSRAALLCMTEDDAGGSPFVCTSDSAYMRLRRTRYDEGALSAWIDRLAAQRLARAYVYFKHEEEGMAAGFARRLLDLWRARK